MKLYFIYDNDTDFYLGMVYAMDWTGARSEYARKHNRSFGSVYATQTRL